MTRQDLRTLFNSRPYFYNSGTMYNLADHHYLTNYTFTRPKQISSIDDQWFITIYSDLGLDDPDLAMSDYKASIRDLQSYEDCTYLFTVPELDYDLAIDLYPEYFI